MTSTLAAGPLDEVLTQRSIVVCVGTGGIGKTSVAAALAVRAAQRGRRVALLTIDPARRLADALGLDAASENERGEHLVAGPWTGTLDASMLDAKATFDELVRRQARDEAHAQRIVGSTFYRNVADNLSGIHEHMAIERLYALHRDERYDLVVVDTPPSRHAVAFLDAPHNLGRLLDNSVFRALVAKQGPAKVLGSAAQLVLRPLSRVVGTGVVDDTLTFFRAFDGIEHGVRERAQRAQAALRSSATAFVLVAAPRDDTMTESQHLVGHLRKADVAVEAAVLNRTTPLLHAVDALAPDSPHRRAVDDYRAAAAHEAAHVASLHDLLGGAPVVRVPMLPFDVHDLDAIVALAAALDGAGGHAG